MKHAKDFVGWSIKKQALDASSPTIYFHEREVWWCHLGVNIGFEQDGKNHNYARPVVILKTYSVNAALIVPLTSKSKPGTYYLDMGRVSGREARAVLSQIRFADKRRLINKVDVIDQQRFEKLRSAIIQMNLV